MNIQRKAEEHAAWHFTDSIDEILVPWETTHQFRRLFIAGPVEATRHFREALPKSLRQAVAALKEVSIHITDHDLLKQSLHWLSEAGREKEKKDVRRLIAAAKKNGQALTHMEPVLDALQQGIVWKIYYADDLAAEGFECGGCGLLAMENSPICPYCGANAFKVPDLMELIVHKVLSTGGEIDKVQGPAKEMLKRTGGIGAFLRFDTELRKKAV
jgi:peptide subunit release factor 1 (eRF1)